MRNCADDFALAAATTDATEKRNRSLQSDMENIHQRYRYSPG